MKITNVSFHKVKGETKFKSYATVVIDDVLIITGFRLIEVNSKLEVFFPERSSKQPDGKFSHHKVVYALNDETRKKFSDAILEAYYKKQ